MYSAKSNRKRPWKKAPKECKKDAMKFKEKAGKDTEGNVRTNVGRK